MLQRAGTGVGKRLDEYGTWSFPGGWLEHGEDAQTAAIRECEEETGIHVKFLKNDGFSVVTVLDKTIVNLYVICKYIYGEPTNKEPDKALCIKWIPQECLTELDLFQATDLWWRQPK